MSLQGWDVGKGYRQGEWVCGCVGVSGSVGPVRKGPKMGNTKVSKVIALSAHFRKLLLHYKMFLILHVLSFSRQNVLTDISVFHANFNFCMGPNIFVFLYIASVCLIFF